jgi:two-component system, chemotaxis family, sensor kinase Cph1
MSIKPSQPDGDELSREMQEFLERVVHDLRAAQRGISLSAETMLADLEQQLDESNRQTFQRLLDGTDKMDAILSAVSDYSITLARSRYSLAPVPAEAALQSALFSLSAEIRQTDAVVRHQPLPEVVADRDKLAALFRCLIGNALKYRGLAAPQIEIRAEQNSDSCIFSVRDNGIGIDPKYQNGLFAPFRRLHGAEYPGVGLGLAMCKKIVDGHGGKIWLESAAGAGTTFFFALPQ